MGFRKHTGKVRKSTSQKYFQNTVLQHQFHEFRKQNSVIFFGKYIKKVTTVSVGEPTLESRINVRFYIYQFLKKNEGFFF